MDCVTKIKEELERGFSKATLEKLIGLPKNNLASILTGNRNFSKTSELKINKFFQLPKLDPLDFLVKRNDNKVLINDFNKVSDLIEPEKPLGHKKSNFNINISKNKSTPKGIPSNKENSTHQLIEGSNAFFMKYGAFTHEETKKLKI